MQEMTKMSFGRYIEQLADGLECLRDDFRENKGEIDLHDYNFNTEILQGVLTGKILITD